MPSLRIKRTPLRSPTLANDLYISRTSNLHACTRRILQLLKMYILFYSSQRHPQLILHGMGAALAKTVELALRVQSQDPRIQLLPRTLTIECIDDVEVDKDSDLVAQKRLQSAIEITLSLVE